MHPALPYLRQTKVLLAARAPATPPPRYSKHQPPCDLRGHGCHPAPEPHTPTMNNTSPSVRDADLHLDNHEIIQRHRLWPNLQLPTDRAANGHSAPNIARSESTRTQPRKEGGGEGADHIHDRHPLCWRLVARPQPESPANLPTRHLWCCSTTAADTDLCAGQREYYPSPSVPVLYHFRQGKQEAPNFHILFIQ